MAKNLFTSLDYKTGWIFYSQRLWPDIHKWGNVARTFNNMEYGGVTTFTVKLPLTDLYTLGGEGDPKV